MRQGRVLSQLWHCGFPLSNALIVGILNDISLICVLIHLLFVSVFIMVFDYEVAFMAVMVMYQLVHVSQATTDKYFIKYETAIIK